MNENERRITDNQPPRKPANKSRVPAKRSDNIKSRRSTGVQITRAGRGRASSMHAVRAPKVINLKKKDKPPFPWAVILSAFMLTALFLFMMMNYAEVDKYRSEITELDKKITTMQKTQTELEVNLSNKYNLEEIRDYAETELGMVKKETLVKHVVRIGQADRTTMMTYEDIEEEGGLGFLLTGLGEVVRGFLE